MENLERCLINRSIVYRLSLVALEVVQRGVHDLDSKNKLICESVTAIEGLSTTKRLLEISAELASLKTVALRGEE